MSTFDELVEIFRRFPGIGPRQSKRFVYHLLSKNDAELSRMSKLLTSLKREVVSCSECFRFFPHSGTQTICPTCTDPNRNDEVLMVVPKDADFESIERTGTFSGRYFVLGGTLPLLEKEGQLFPIRRSELLKRIDNLGKRGLKEIILATNLNPEGEHTADEIKKLIEPQKQKLSLKISTLGRGLSTGTELEYVDAETIKSALDNRIS